MGAIRSDKTAVDDEALELRVRREAQGMSDAEIREAYECLAVGARACYNSLSCGSVEVVQDFRNWRYSGNSQQVEKAKATIEKLVFLTVQSGNESKLKYLRNVVKEDPAKLLKQRQGKGTESVQSLDLFLGACKENEVLGQYALRGLNRKTDEK